MSDLLLKNPRSYKGTLAFTAVLCVIFLGIFFRFYHIDQRLFWEDEVYAVCRVSGYTEQEMHREIHEDQVYSFQYLEKYLHPAKNSRGLLAVIKTVREHPLVQPLHESLLWCWIQIFGDSIAAIRSFSAFLSLFAFPLVIWLCWELFRSYKVGWIAAALIAVSPYQVFYAQEARYYSLWCVAILLSSAALLRAVRLASKKAWTFYAASLVFGIYSHAFFCFVAIAHVVYVLALERNAIKKMVFSGLAALLIFSPQIYLIILFFKKNVLTAYTWIMKPVSIEVLIERFSLGLATVFYEPRMAMNFLMRVHAGEGSKLIVGLFLYVLVLFVEFLLIFFWRKAARKQAMLILMVFSINFFGLLFPDLIFGGWKIGVSRYLMASFLMVQVSMAFFVYSLLESGNRVKKVSGYFLLAALFLIGAVSCVWQSRQAAGAYSYTECVYKEAATYLDAYPGSLVVRAERQDDLRKLFIMFYYLRDRSRTFFTHPSRMKRFFVDLDHYPKSLFIVSTEPKKDSQAIKWANSSNEYRLAPIGPKHWQGDYERIYEIRKGIAPVKAHPPK